MLAPLATLVLSLAASATAHSVRSPHVRRHRNVPHLVSYTPRNEGYKLVQEYSGKSFFHGWDFFTDDDPTHGLVNFVDGDAASKLAYVQDDNTVVMAVDQSAEVGVGGKRNSIRITTKKAFERGLFIADIYSMPHGCSVWPAYWSIGEGKPWPQAGEIDIIEGVNKQAHNQITLHSGPGCLLDSAAKALGRLMNTQCESSNGNNAGCAFEQAGDATFGRNFNMQAGGVFAHTLELDGISVWFFDRNAVPDDIQAQQPDPSSWGTPAAFFPNTQCDILGHFLPQHLIFDITICGDWAGPTYDSSGCPGTCEQAVANASNYNVAQWKIASVRIYQ